MVATRSQGARTARNRAAEEAIQSGGNYKLRKLLGVKPKPKPRRAAQAGPGGCAQALQRCEAKVARLVAQLKAGHVTAIKRRQRVAGNYRTADLFDTSADLRTAVGMRGNYTQSAAERAMHNTRYAETKWRNEIAKTNANTRNAAKKASRNKTLEMMKRRAAEHRKLLYGDAPRQR